MFRKVFVFFIICALPITSQAADKNNEPSVSVEYGNIKQLIKNYYASQDFCKGSSKNDGETDIMCNYANAAVKKLDQLGWCFGYDDQPESDKEWIKCPKNTTKKLKPNIIKPTKKLETNTVSNDIIKEALTDVDKSFCKDGLQGLVEIVKQCYMLYDGQIYQSANKCMLEDLSLISYNQKVVNYVKNKTGNSITIPFLTDQDISDREKRYFTPFFGDIANAMDYYNPGINEITDKMSECSTYLIGQ
ncbi:hypothetical protein [Commensalibacter melissae]|uniref:hypothetical protein n=1 Tax=Commensalibacter melissae TaxID=2070537 RepID=UPI0012D984B0|nr:hypothetical protein [Commensalibacter melissae]MUG81430.1 hypothetical protein [Commensalibacter melissae]